MVPSELYESFWRCIDAINTRVKVEFDISDVEQLKRLEVLNALKSPKHCWRGQVWGRADPMPPSPLSSSRPSDACACAVCAYRHEHSALGTSTPGAYLQTTYT